METLLAGQTISIFPFAGAAAESVSDDPQPGKFTTFGGDFAGGIVDGYSVYLPASYGQSDKTYPVIMFLSGGCAVGGEVEDMYDYSGLLNMIHEPSELPEHVKKEVLDSFIIVSPHMKDGIFDERQFFA